jgi:hypothetical protein
MMRGILGEEGISDNKNTPKFPPPDISKHKINGDKREELL